MARKNQPPDPMSLPPRWKVPEQCSFCGARVEQAVQSRADQPTCTFCNEPLPCEALPPPAPAPTGFEGLMGGIVQGAMNNAMAQQQAMAQQWMNQISQPGALAAMNNPFQTGGGIRFHPVKGRLLEMDQRGQRFRGPHRMRSGARP